MSFLKKNRYLHCCLALFFFSLTARSQINITGRVLGESNDSPLPGASVYFNNTTIGTYTNQQGYFNFETIRLLNTDLVISCAGYETLVYRPVAEKVEGKKVVFKLRADTVAPKNKLLVSTATRKRMLEIFYQFFLGLTREAIKCTVTNEGNIYFVPDINNRGFKAYADTPLVIINNLLGYKLIYNLVEFTFDEFTGQHELFGYTHYQELGNDKKFIKNRRNCYYGSTLHFYRSLITNRLYEQGFTTFLLQKVKDKITQRLQEIQPVELRFGMYLIPATAREILFIDSTNNFSLPGKGTLLVQYYSDPSSKEFLNERGLMTGSLEKGVESYIVFNAPVGINYSGVLSAPESVEYTGFWMYENAANSLPYDYQPESE